MAMIPPLLLVTLLSPASARPQAATASIEVRVVDMASGAPLKGSRIFGTPVGPTIATTDATGILRFDGLQPGRYEFMATQPGYLTATTATSVVAEPGGRHSLTLPLVRGGVLSGRVYDANREPLRNIGH